MAFKTEVRKREASMNLEGEEVERRRGGGEKERRWREGENLMVSFRLL